VATLADPGANGFHPAGSPLTMSARPDVDEADDDGDASPFSVVGSAEISWDSVVCCVPAEVVAAWADRAGLGA
jgi:hypothetical protein